MTRIAVIGLGEAGARYATDLAAAGVEVVGFDAVRSTVPGVAVAASLEEAVAGAEVVLSIVGGSPAVAVARAALPAMDEGAVLADLNTASPAIKREVAALGAAAGVAVADVAVLAPVPRAGSRTSLLASGDGAAMIAERLGPFGVPVTVLPGGAGEAARLKLLRSVFMKGLAALVIEGVGAARAMGAEPWLRRQMAGELGPDGDALVDRLIDGTYQHAERRSHEVEDALAVLEEADLPADMTRATLTWFTRILADRPS